MMSNEKLSIALILALSSNAVLLVLLLLKTAGVSFHEQTKCDVQSPNIYVNKPIDAGTSKEYFQRGLYQEQQRKESKTLTNNWDRLQTISGTLSKDCFDFLKRSESFHFVSQAEGSLYEKFLIYFCSADLFKIDSKSALNTARNSHKKRNVRRPNKRRPNFPTVFDTSRHDTEGFQRHSVKSSLKNGLLRSLLAQKALNRGAPLHSKTKSEMTSITPVNNATIPNTSSQQDVSNSTLKKEPQISDIHRSRRAVYTDPSGKVSVIERDPVYKLTEVFSTFTDEEIEKFQSPVSDLLIPSMMHFEGMIIREIEDLQDSIIAHDLRLEQLEKFMLNMANSDDMEPQSDSVDNKSELDNLKHVLGEESEGYLEVGNGSLTIETLGGDGSGDGEELPLTPTTKLPPTTENVAFYDLYRDLSAVEQKVMALENYNVMSDSELRRIRNEVTKMDDRVTELDRKHRNLQVRTSMSGYKITELEMFMSRSELSLHNAADMYNRLSARLESFKDRLSEFSSDLHGVTVEFNRQDQIANELRAADAYKAHDISEMRKSMLGLEGRVNGLYLVLDQNVDTVRNDIRTMLDRLCFSNNLSC